MASSERSIRTRVLHSWWFRGLAIFLLFCLLIILLFPVAAKYGLESWLLKNGADSASVESIRYNPFVSKLRMTGLNVSAGGQSLLSNGSMLLDLNLRDLLHRDIHIEQSTYDQLKIDIEQLPDGTWRFGTYSLAGGSAQEPAAKEGKAGSEESEKTGDAGATPGTPWIFSADKIVLADCVVDFKTPDLAYSLAVKRAELVDFSTARDDKNGNFELLGTLNGKEIHLHVTSLTVAPDVALSGTVKVDGFALDSLQKMLQQSLPVFGGTVELDGKVDFGLSAKTGMSAGYDGGIKLLTPAVGSGDFKIQAENIGWNGKVNYQGELSGQTGIITDGTLDSAGLAVMLPPQQLTVKSDNITLAGKTEVVAGKSVKVVNGGKLSVAGVVVDMEGVHYGQQSFGWDGHVDFDGAGSAVSVAGDLSGSDLELGLAAASLDVAVGSLGLQGDTRIDYGGKVNIVNSGKLSVAGVALDMEGMHYAQQTFGWDGRVDLDGDSNMVAVSGDLSGADMQLALAASNLDVAVGSLGLQGDTSINYGDALHLETRSRLETGDVRVNMPSLAVSEQRLAWDGTIGYGAGDAPIIDLAGSLASGPFSLDQGGMSAGYESFDIAEVQGKISENLQVTGVDSKKLQLQLPGEMPLVIAADQFTLPRVGSEDFKEWQVEGLTVTGISGKSQVNGKELFSLSSGKVGTVEASAAGEAEIRNIVLATLEFLGGQTADGKAVGTVKEVAATDISFSPESGTNIEKVGVEGLNINVIRDKEGNININTLLGGMRQQGQGKAPAAADVAEQTAGSGSEADGKTDKKNGQASFRLGTFTLGDKSVVDFTDNTLPIPFVTNVGLDKFQVTGIDSSTPEKRAEVDVAGSLEGRAPILVKGNIAPFAPQPAMAFTLDLKNYPLSRLSPYTVQAVGTALASGILRLHSKMSLENDYLDLENDVELKKLETKTISPELAAELNNQLPIPLDAALSVLRDSDRNISLNIPLKGPVSDLSVGVSDVIITALGKAIVPAASSYLVYSLGPYGALAYVGMKVGEKMLEVSLPPVIYAPGAVEVPAGQDDYLQRVAKILSDRPESDLNLCPQVLPGELDPPGSTGKSGDAAAAEAVAKNAADNGKTAEAPNASSAAPAAKNEAQLLQLGQQRGDALKTYLMEKFGVADERLLICEPSITTEKKAKPSVMLNM